MFFIRQFLPLDRRIVLATERNTPSQTSEAKSNASSELFPGCSLLRVSLNAWAKGAAPDNNQFAYLVLGSRDRGMKLERTHSGLNSRLDIREGPQPDSQLRWPEVKSCHADK